MACSLRCVVRWTIGWGLVLVGAWHIAESVRRLTVHFAPEGAAERRTLLWNRLVQGELVDSRQVYIVREFWLCRRPLEVPF